jgi:hypothetical protein
MFGTESVVRRENANTMAANVKTFFNYEQAPNAGDNPPRASSLRHDLQRQPRQPCYRAVGLIDLLDFVHLCHSATPGLSTLIVSLHSPTALMAASLA